MFLLDTNVISELRRPERADRNVIAWARATPAASFFLSAISILEIELGALLSGRKDAAQGAVLRAWIDDQILPRFEGRILAVDTIVAQRCARLHIPDPRAERDALIAATAMVHGLTVVTRNVADFEPVGVALLNPWQPRDGEGASN
jgi:toxin FitB